MVMTQARLLAALLLHRFIHPDYIIILNRMLSKAFFYTNKGLKIQNNAQEKKI